jgi:hypothetical protein
MRTEEDIAASQGMSEITTRIEKEARRDSIQSFRKSRALLLL